MDLSVVAVRVNHCAYRGAYHRPAPFSPLHAPRAQVASLLHELARHIDILQRGQESLRQTVDKLRQAEQQQQQAEQQRQQAEQQQQAQQQQQQQQAEQQRQQAEQQHSAHVGSRTVVEPEAPSRETLPTADLPAATDLQGLCGALLEGIDRFAERQVCRQQVAHAEFEAKRLGHIFRLHRAKRLFAVDDTDLPPAFVRQHCKWSTVNALFGDDAE